MSVIIYSEYCEALEEENLLLRKEVRFLKKQLSYKSYGEPLHHVINLDVEEDVES